MFYDDEKDSVFLEMEDWKADMSTMDGKIGYTKGRRYQRSSFSNENFCRSAARVPRGSMRLYRKGAARGGAVAMTTAQTASAFLPEMQQPRQQQVSAPGAAGSGGGAASLGPCSSSAATVTVVTGPAQAQSPVYLQNGSVDGGSGSESPEGNTRDSPSRSGSANAQVTAQVVVSNRSPGVVSVGGTGGPSTPATPGDPGQSASGSSGPTVVAGSATTATLVGSPHYITVTVSEGDAVGSEGVPQGVHSTYVQYVEGSADQAIYAATNGQMAYPVYTVGETATMYSAASGQYYSTGNSTAVTYSQVAGSMGQGTTSGGQGVSGGAGAPGGTTTVVAQATNQQQPAQLLSSQGSSTYLIQQSVDSDGHALITTRASPQTVGADAGGTVTYMVPGSTANLTLDGDGHPNLSHATRVSPATVQWLLENYETAEGVSLPRSTLYNHYLRHCTENKLDPVNAASFGKLIRSVFLGLRTRRLGTRGNSKYHYYGIRVKPNSSLNQLSEDGTTIAVGPRQMQGGNSQSGVNSQGSQKRYKSLSSMTKNSGDGTQYDQGSCSNPGSNLSNSASPQHNQFLGDASNAIPDFPEIVFTGLPLPEDVNLEDVDTLRSIYREHCEAFLDAVVNLEFNTVESLWREFWRSQDNNNGEECEEEKYLSKTKLYLLCKCPPVQDFVRRVDYHFYQNLVEVLIPDVLRPIPSSLTQAIRNFAKGLEGWLTSAMNGCPQEMMQLKVSAVSAFAQTLRRYTSLNHLAQAARAVLQNSAQISQMLADLNRVDFHNVQEQASWVCQCEDGVVQRLEADFKVTLEAQNSLEQWAAWLKGVVAQVLKPYEGKANFAKAARQFLLKWSFYSSMVIRDLTLRSAASFGSFHLIRLLYDEYMFYLIEHQVANATGETPIAVMGEKSVPSIQDEKVAIIHSSYGVVPCNGGSSSVHHSNHMPAGLLEGKVVGLNSGSLAGNPLLSQVQSGGDHGSTASHHLHHHKRLKMS
ncbi:DNA-binding protein RFX2 isoform X2 [Ischnura elegans]|uniref:DNA-binding protein RFX2 isoform X2 n=1 Tax=Ischnura elegans TaxID=197161 RepID=UPI001ED867A9|nr:DNA-binding protein RFX2 isoform X2 [Ischnura elegans]